MAPRRISLLSFILLCASCVKHIGVTDPGSNYPKEVAAILLSKCATAGCHNPASKTAAAQLSLSSWNDLFLGASGGPVVIPFSPEFSTLCFFTNTSAELGPLSSPTMPLGARSLSKEDYLLLKNWIKNGAPNAGGEIKFSDNVFRNKIYVTNQLCDLVIVIDAESKLAMRYIEVGSNAKTDFPVCVKVSGDKKNWYVSFLASHILQKFDAANDTYSEKVDLGEGLWSSFELTADSKFAFCVDNSNPGKIAYVDLQQMKVLSYYKNPNFIYPRIAGINNATHKLYVGAENGNYISVIDVNDPIQPKIKQVILDGSAAITNQPSDDPIFLLSDERSDLCFIACRNSSEIKILNMTKDSVTGSVLLNAAPTTMDIDKKENYLFVSCMNDTLSFPGNQGSVKVIEINSQKILKTINSGYQPIGVSVDTDLEYVAIVNSNISPKGPGPHHTSACAGRNGYLTFIDLNTLELLPSLKYELAVYPYAAALR